MLNVPCVTLFVTSVTAREPRSCDVGIMSVNGNGYGCFFGAHPVYVTFLMCVTDENSENKTFCFLFTISYALQ